MIEEHPLHGEDCDDEKADGDDDNDDGGGGTACHVAANTPRESCYLTISCVWLRCALRPWSDLECSLSVVITTEGLGRRGSGRGGLARAEKGVGVRLWQEVEDTCPFARVRMRGANASTHVLVASRIVPTWHGGLSVLGHVFLPGMTDCLYLAGS
eukprot:TRINITY_DN2148_c0_g1_i3.p1 TRINITY_DN2148_c0_g1~~TRINITY_DN2148_c0_g1_i3.p1  ORF type:complete len:155 (-),score=15.06 TRINITY_DN2148_c0_g1_i3:197-661(-)